MEKKDWLHNPDTISKIVVAVLLVALFGLIHIFAHDFFTNTFKLTTIAQGPKERKYSTKPSTLPLMASLKVLVKKSWAKK